MTAATPSIRHTPDQQRFHTRVDGQQAVLEYRLDAGVMTILHTGVPEAIGGRGIAGALMAAAVNTARQQGWLIRPECSYARAYFDRHPELHALLA